MSKLLKPTISASDLNEIISDPDLIVLDASWYMPGTDRNPEQDFLNGHVPGAQRFDFDADVVSKTVSLPHMMPTPGAFQTHAQARGINPDSPIVVYDGAGVFSAPRVWWMFRQMGHANIAVLDGGLPAWTAISGAVETGSAHQPLAGQFIAKPVPALIASALDVQAAINDPDIQIVDARAAPRFNGEAPEPRAGLRSGHMPSARNLPFNEILTNGHFRAADEIRAAFKGARLEENKPTISSCGSGVTAAVLALASELAGLGALAVYDGSWSEWGQYSHPEFPIETGPAK